MGIVIIPVLPHASPAIALERQMQDEYVEMYGEPDQDPDNSMAGAIGVLLGVSRKGDPLALGAWSLWPDGAGKVRLLYVVPEERNRRLAEQMLGALERRMVRAGCTEVRFETGPKQHAAVRLYERLGYERTEPFGFYAENEGSHFFRRALP